MTTDSEAWEHLQNLLLAAHWPGLATIMAEMAQWSRERQKRGDFGAPQRKPRPTIQELEAILAAEDAAPVDAASWGAKVTAEFRRLERLAEDRLYIIERLTKERDEQRTRAEAAEQRADAAQVMAAGETIARKKAESLLKGALWAQGAGEAWPLADVLVRLANAADHLLGHHDCDGHGWEEIGGCAKRARSYADAVRAVLSKAKAQGFLPDGEVTT